MHVNNVRYRGLVVEHGGTDTVIQHPVHPYTQSLLSAIPVLRGIEAPGPDRVRRTAPPDERSQPPGCLFAPRCPFAAGDCAAAMSPLSQLGGAAQEHACLHPAPRSVIAVPAG